MCGSLAPWGPRGPSTTLWQSKSAACKATHFAQQRPPHGRWRLSSAAQLGGSPSWLACAGPHPSWLAGLLVDSHGVPWREAGHPPAPQSQATGAQAGWLTACKGRKSPCQLGEGRRRRLSVHRGSQACHNHC